MNIIEETRYIMKKYNIRANKSLGQNFLINNEVVENIVNSSDISKEDMVIEIGPGLGTLTKYLLEKAGKVLCVELDTKMIKILQDRFSLYDNFELINEDILKVNLNEIIIENKKDGKIKNVKIVANLPYYITTPIIEKIVNLDLKFKLMRIMVQKEVGQRFCAKVGSKDYGSFTVFLNYNFNIEKNFIVSRNSFYPRPNVDSMIVSFYPKDRIMVSDLDYFYKIVRDSFKFKRKTLRNNLKEYDLGIVEMVLDKYGYDLSVRAEQLDVNIFCEISNELSI